ncbi:YolD-like family protein [Paenibacillus sp. FSL W8-0194]|uniref:YolD-like family protein n=1 Tax=Paenibacillus sp. FSL W8-0194 TaxID=2921711 RepID=UPI0030DD2109
MRKEGLDASVVKAVPTPGMAPCEPLLDSSRMMLPQHKETILVKQKELNRMAKLVIDEQEWQLIGQVLQDSFNGHIKVTLTLFDPFNARERSGFVTVIS